MAALDSSSYRRQDLLPHLSAANVAAAATPRRATLSTPAPPFTFSNTFDRPHSRSSDRYPGASFDRPYPYRRSTISGHSQAHSQGHNVNDAPQLTARADAHMMWSDSASSSPNMSSVVGLHGTHHPHGSSPAPSGGSPVGGGSPNLAPPVFDYEHLGCFTLCSSPEFPNSMEHPRTMPPPPILYPTAATNVRVPPLPAPSNTNTASTTPTVSPAASSFCLDHTIEPPSPRHHANHHPMHQQDHQDHQAGQDDLVARLRNRISELEFILRFSELQSPDVKARVHAEIGLGLDPQEGSSDASSSAAGPSHADPHGGTGPPSLFTTYHSQPIGPAPADWEHRTSARLKRFCALNRAGNALCAWHDSRRERRTYPPRMAPPHTLNCGCTYAEALFEESLARNGVGSFYPGDHVRMDPALRNPLLRLLEERYGYRDGDFERTPSGGWREGEDAHSWEQKGTNSTRSRRER